METNQMNEVEAYQKLQKAQFEGVRDIKVIKTGKVEVQTIKFAGWYAPEDKLQEIYQSKEPLYSYVEWVLSKEEDEVVNVYDEWTDEPIGTETINIAKDHVERFTTWVKCVQADGYEVRLVPQ